MKVIIAGATGFVGAEVIRQALHHPSITSVVALGRRATQPPEAESPNATKLRSVVCENFSQYSDSVREELKGADACIWLLAVTPTKSQALPWDEVRKVCYDYAVTGIESLASLAKETNKSVRVVYTSGSNAQRDQTKKPWILGDYCLLRGECETKVLDVAKQSNGAVQSCVLKPGLISDPVRDGLMIKASQLILGTLISLPSVEVKDVAATALELAVNGFERDTFTNEDLVTIGQQAREKLLQQ